MSTWLKASAPVRTQPRLWVETMWLVESREPLVVTRTINLHAGLNIVWAKESLSNDASGLASAGHGVGKTSLCLLLRYVLGDDAPAIAALRSKAAGSFPKGGVAARVHVDGSVWLVFRPYGLYSHSLAAAQCDALAPLLDGTSPNEFEGYGRALEQFSIGRLAARSLPGTNQPLEWRHLLAWCIREQRTRFDGFYHWREGEGLGFKRSRRDPPLLVGSVLGLVDLELDRLLRDIEAKQKQVEECKERIPDLERAPAFALAHADRQLRLRVRAEEDEPLFSTTVGESVESRVFAALHFAEQEEGRWEAEVAQADEALAAEQVRLRELAGARELAKLDADIAKSLVDAKQDDFERLTKVRDRLAGLGGRCDPGDIEFSACEYVQKNKSAVNIIWAQDGRQAKVDASVLARRYEARTADYDKAARAVLDQERFISAKKKELHGLRVRIATSETARTFLKQAWEGLQLQHAQRAKGGDTVELVEARRKLQNLEEALASLRAAEVRQRSAQSARVDAIQRLTSVISARLLGEAGYARFVSGHELRPFEVARGGEAYQVLEVLLGDIVCLLDSAVSDGSNHPGFLVHDCPREADMSEVLYRKLFLAAAEAAEQLGNGGSAPFQYIVTTTSAPPEELRGDAHVVLELGPGDDEKLLFKRELMPALPGLEPA